MNNLYKNFIDKNKDLKYSKIQNDMINCVSQSIINSGISVVEAPTGTGKSLSYLLSAINYNLNYDQDSIIVISTNTKLLQEQLIKNDIPKCIKYFNLDDDYFKIVKGKSNYVCSNDLNYLYNNEETNKNLITQLKQWEKNTTTGEIQEISKLLYKYKIPNEAISCDTNTCSTSNCNLDNCFNKKLKASVKNASILIVNHSLLILDLYIKIKTKNKAGVLPVYEHLIVDECHNLYEHIRKIFSVEISFDQIKNLSENVLLTGKKTNLLNSILISLKQISTTTDDNEFIKKLIKNFDNKTLKYKILEIKNECENLLNNSNDNYTFNLNDILKQKLISLLNEIKTMNDFFDINNKKLLDIIDKTYYNNSSLKQKVLKQMGFLVSKVNTLFENLNNYIESFTKENSIPNWIEKNVDKNIITLNNTCVDMSYQIKNLFQNLKSLSFTSATITTGQNNFNYFKNKLALPLLNKPIIELQLPEVFDYKNNTKLFLYNSPYDMYFNKNQFIKDIAEKSSKLINKFNGKTLILFTSYSMLKSFKDNLVVNNNIKVICQGDKPVSNIIQIMKKNDNVVVLGVNSFWEGFDIKGPNLSCLIIVKLPFDVFKNGITEAIKMYYKKNNGNYFMNEYLPNAIIKFKQGMGRLIRSNTDKGIFIILDKRIIEKKYGINFLNVLPNIPINKNLDNIFKNL